MLDLLCIILLYRTSTSLTFEGIARVNRFDDLGDLGGSNDFV